MRSMNCLIVPTGVRGGEHRAQCRPSHDHGVQQAVEALQAGVGYAIGKTWRVGVMNGFCGSETVQTSLVIARSAIPMLVDILADRGL
jgi:hypothetical protein